MASIPIKYLTRLSRKVVVPTDLHGEVFHYSLPAWHDTGDGAVEQVTDIASAKLLLEGGEVLVSKLNPERGAVIHADKHRIPTVCSPEFIALKPRLVDARYTYYLMLSGPVRACLESSVESVTNSHKRARVDRFLASRVEVPDLSTQKAIADFLDCETARIDQLIEKKQRLIRLLEEREEAAFLDAVTGKDFDGPKRFSGVEWIGEIPSHWTAPKITHVAKQETGHTPSRRVAEYWVPEECVIPWVSLADVWQLRSGETVYIEETVEKISYVGMANSAARLLPAGTVILSRTASVGFAGVLAKPMATTQDFAAWICGARIRPKYLYYTLRAMKPEFRRLMMGSTHQTIYMPDIRSFRTPLPPLVEQDRICEKLDRAIAKFRSASAILRTSIDRLREFRSALITAAVTGQIDVTTWGRRGETDRRLERIEEEMSAAPGRGEVAAAS